MCVEWFLLPLCSQIVTFKCIDALGIASFNGRMMNIVYNKTMSGESPMTMAVYAEIYESIGEWTDRRSAHGAE